MVHILIAPQAFKETLSPNEAATCIAKKISERFADAEMVLMPVADGGDGTLEVLAKETIFIQTVDPFLNPIEVPIGIRDDFAIVEFAKIAGLCLVPKDKRDPVAASSFGVGLAIKEACKRGFNKIVVALGGSATCDLGSGIVEALKNFDEIKKCEITCLCDVTSTLVEAKRYLLQKGANQEQQEFLEKKLSTFAEKYPTIANLSGSGAAGGAAFGLAAFFNAKLVSGGDWILKTIGFEDVLKTCDVVVTGEGRLDGQTASGKAPFCVAKMAHQLNIPVIAYVGSISEDAPTDLFEEVIFLNHSF
jgi:glycerate kinase